MLLHAPPNAVQPPPLAQQQQNQQQQPQLSSPVPFPTSDRFVESSISSTQPALEAWPGRHGFVVIVRTPPAAHGRQ